MQMTRSRVLAIAALAVLVSQLPALAQLEVLSTRAKEKAISEIVSKIKGNASTPMAAHLQRAQKAQTDKAVLASRVAADFPKAKGQFVHYAVPPMSNIQRLPNVYPTDGFAGEPVQIIAAKDEFEPGSFLVYPFEDLGKVTFSLTPFKTKDGKTFPADQLDMKVIKVWYQNKNAWYSYFGDTGFKLCPELLLNDEDLIRVDTEKEANYARLKDKDGKVTEKWINPPRKMNQRHFTDYRSTYGFSPMKENFRDAKTLQPVLLEEGSFKNFFLTAHVTKDIAPAVYRGSIRLVNKTGKELGTIPVDLRVLPFELPAPKTYFDPDLDFRVASYSYLSIPMIMEENGGNRELAVKQMEAVLRDQVEHNQNMHWLKSEDAVQTYQLMGKVGMCTNPLVASLRMPHFPSQDLYDAHAQRLAKWCDEHLGHHNVYLGYGDEPGPDWLVKTRPIFRAYQEAGFKFIIAGRDSVFYKTGYIYDWHNIAKDPIDDSSTALWNQIGGSHIAWYACMHVGPENPAFNRRQYGLAAYLAGYSAFCNYAHHLGPYDDDSEGYRPMVFAYGIYDGVLDTIQWEGFREGIDDIRYATLMTSLARKAAASDDLDTRYEGRKALQFLASINRESDDLNAIRLEMTDWILKLSDILDKQAR